MTRTPEELLAQTLAALPPAERASLLSPAGAVPVAAASASDPVWLGEQVAASARVWRTDDRRVLATVWWYSVSTWLQMPSLASFLVTGVPLSPALADLTLHRRGDLFEGATSTAVLAGPEELAAALREAFEGIISVLAEVGGVRPAPLWAVASDSTANALLRLGQATGQVPRATALAVQLGRQVGPPLPEPVFVQPAPVLLTTARSPLRVRRASCCLLHLAPGLPMCRSCPKLGPAGRLL